MTIPPSVKGPASKRKLGEIGDDGLVIYVDGRFYVVNEEDWHNEKNLLEVDSEGEAGVLVRRGAILARIPSGEPPTGAYCVLVNLNALK